MRGRTLPPPPPAASPPGGGRERWTLGSCPFPRLGHPPPPRPPPRPSPTGPRSRASSRDWPKTHAPRRPRWRLRCSSCRPGRGGRAISRATGAAEARTSTMRRARAPRPRGRSTERRRGSPCEPTATRRASGLRSEETRLRKGLSSRRVSRQELREGPFLLPDPPKILPLPRLLRPPLCRPTTSRRRRSVASRRLRRCALSASPPGPRSPRRDGCGAGHPGRQTWGRSRWPCGARLRTPGAGAWRPPRSRRRRTTKTSTSISQTASRDRSRPCRSARRRQRERRPRPGPRGRSDPEGCPLESSIPTLFEHKKTKKTALSRAGTSSAHPTPRPFAAIHDDPPPARLHAFRARSFFRPSRAHSHRDASFRTCVTPAGCRASSAARPAGRGWGRVQ